MTYNRYPEDDSDTSYESYGDLDAHDTVPMGEEDFDKPASAPEGRDVGHTLVILAGGLIILFFLIGLITAFSSSGPRSPRLAGGSAQPQEPARSARSDGASPDQPRGSDSAMPKRAARTQSVIQRVAGGVVTVQVVDSRRNRYAGTGTGFIISPDGHILTNEHVIKNATTYIVKMQGGESMRARLLASDPNLDIALLKVSQRTATIYLDIGNSDGIQIGQEVFALGYPLGSKLGTELTVTEGIVSSIRGRDGGWLQISAAVNPGNSGGPLISADSGQVIGLVTAKIDEADNIAFARPINVCKGFIDRYLR